MWVVLALSAALFDGVKHIAAKHLTRSFDSLTLAVSTSFVIVLVTLPLVLIVGVPEIGEGYLSALIITGVVNAITLFLVMKALSLTDLSLVTPLYGLSPVFLLFTSPFFLGEVPSFSGLAGVLMVVLGAYSLNFKSNLSLEPLREILNNKGQRLILLVTILWAFSSNFYKIGMQNSSFLFFVFSLNVCITIILLPVLVKHGGVRSLLQNAKYLFPLGALSAVVSLFQWSAANLGMLVYVLSIKRASVLLSVLAGKVIFQEENVRQRLLASLVILLGVTVIAFS